MPESDDVLNELRTLIRKNRQRIRQSRKQIEEFRETVRVIRVANQRRKAIYNPKIVPLPLPASNGKTKSVARTTKIKKAVVINERWIDGKKTASV